MPSFSFLQGMDKQSKFGHIKTQEDVAQWLGITWESLRYCVYRMPENARYRTFFLPKKGGGMREIQAPCPQLKAIQTKLLDFLGSMYEPRIAAHGYISDRSILSNARMHLGCKVLLNIDLKDFFPSIHLGRVIGLFRSWPLGFGKQAATILAQICTFQRKLPQGAPTSPLISNMICYKLDRELTNLAKIERCIVTRYADDITISSRYYDLPKSIVQSGDLGKVVLGEKLSEIIAAANFSVNPDKVRMQKRSQRLVVTGLKINKFPNVSKRTLSQIRAMLHAWRKHGLKAAQLEYQTKYNAKKRNPYGTIIDFRHVIVGKLVFVGQIRGFSDKRFSKLAAELYDLDPQLLPKTPSYDVAHQAKLASCVLTDDEEMQTGSGFFLKGVGLITCAHVAEFATRIFYPDSEEQAARIQFPRSSSVYDLAIGVTSLLPRSELEHSSRKVAPGTGIFSYGFPQFNRGFSGALQRGEVVGYRPKTNHSRYIVSTRIVEGNSGGPVLNAFGEVIGVAVTGDSSQDRGYSPSDYSAVPIGFLETLISQTANSHT